MNDFFDTIFRRPVRVGDHVCITNKHHPWFYSTGVYLGLEDTQVGKLHKIRLDGGQEVMADRADFRRVG